MATRSDTPALTMFPTAVRRKSCLSDSCLLACCGPRLSEIATPLPSELTSQVGKQERDDRASLPLESGDSIDLSGRQRSYFRREVDETPFIVLGCAGLKSERT